MRATKEILDHIQNKKAFIIDMDGVIYHGDVLLPGAGQFCRLAQARKKEILNS